MSREWRRVSTDTLCGGCNEHIAREVPALFIKLPNVTRERVRCQKCAGDAPPDLPPRVVLRGESVGGVKVGGTTKPMRSIATAIPRDISSRLLGERE